MGEYIPFITGQDACGLVGKFYNDAEFARVPLDRASTLLSNVPPTIKVWLDPTVDGLDDLPSRRPRPERNNTWYEFMKAFHGFEDLGDITFWEKPDPSTVATFVGKVLDACATFKPAWITVPQLPIVSDSSRNKINRALAKAAGMWKTKTAFSGGLILPLILTNQEQVNGKTERNPKVKQAETCYIDAQATGLWVVDKSLEDASGSRTLRNKRFPGLIALHEELNEKIAAQVRIAGPYWGLNLVLWARGLVNHPAIGIGNAYQYFLAGGPMNTPNAYLAVAPLRRRVGVAGLDKWLDETLEIVDSNHPDYAALTDLRKNFHILSTPPVAREQVAKFYKAWFNRVATSPAAGRPMALFQDLSMAYAFGKALPDFENEGTARRPEAVAEPLMLSCL
jgi:hypothetical protein